MTHSLTEHWRMKKAWWAILLLFLLSSCGMQDLPTSPIPEAKISSKGISSIDVNLTRGDVSIINSNTDQIVVNGRILGSDTSGFSIDIQDDILSIQFKDEGKGLAFFGDKGKGNALYLAIPRNIPLAVKIFDGDVTIEGNYAFLDVDSVSANIQASNISGWIRLRSGRGDLILKNGAGEYHLLGEHGRIVMQQINGKIEASTILGNIEYRGIPGSEDDINLEVDHGSISITMLQGTNVRYSLQTANGEVVCMLPDIIEGPNTCEGRLGDGEGMLKARSVSGKIVIDSQP